MGRVLYMVIFFAIIAMFYLTRFQFLKKEIKRATSQLAQFNSELTEKKIDLAYYDKDFEKLANEINAQIDLTKRANAEKRRTENELKQAISNISHDIRTPMTSILGYIQLLESQELSKEKKDEYTNIVKNGALRLKVLLEDFFELSIIETADYPLKNETMKLNHIILDVLISFYEEFHQRNLEPSILLPKEDISIIADPSAVRRVVENLLTNSIKHSKGNVTICLEKSPSSVQLIISNPAYQLTEKDIVHLFDRFYKADQTRAGKGTGLGLAIAKSLMLKMNGSLTAELKDQQIYMKCGWRI